MTRTVDQQVKAAIDGYLLRTHPETDAIAQAMRDLLAGKFAEEPLPEILPPSWPHKKLRLIEPDRFVNHYYYVGADGAAGWAGHTGPAKDSARAAIEAWNAGMRGAKDES